MLAVFLLACARQAPSPSPTPLPPAPLAAVPTPTPVTAPVLKITPRATGTPEVAKARPKRKPRAEKPLARPIQVVQPAMPSQATVPVRRKPAPTPTPTLAPAATASPSPSTPGEDPQAPVEIELVPPEDLKLAPPPPEDPQAVLKTPLAVHYGYTYSRSLLNLERDGVLKVSLVGSGYNTVDVFVHNQGSRPLHFYFFPGMIFKPEKTTTFCSFMQAEVQEVFLYPNSRDRLRFSCFSLDHKKPFPDERFPVSYRLEPNPDLRYPRALRVMRALLAEVASGQIHSPEYDLHRNTIVQIALWQAAAAGRYNADGELARVLGPTEPKTFQSVRTLVYAEADKLQRAANQF